MKRIIWLVCIAACFTSLFSSCSKDDAPAGTSSDYSPSSAGSNWTYLNTSDTTTTTVKLTASNKDTTLNGKTYRLYTSDDGDTTFMGKSGNDYYRLQSFSDVGINNIEELYLKDNKAVNDTWSSNVSIPFGVGSIPATLVYVVKGKDQTMTVQGKSFQKVFHVRLDIQVGQLGALGGGDFYYAEGVGMIKSNVLITPPVTLGGGDPFTFQQELVSYEIK